VGNAKTRRHTALRGRGDIEIRRQSRRAGVRLSGSPNGRAGGLAHIVKTLGADNRLHIGGRGNVNGMGYTIFRKRRAQHVVKIFLITVTAGLGLHLG